MAQGTETDFVVMGIVYNGHIIRRMREKGFVYSGGRISVSEMVAQITRNVPPKRRRAIETEIRNLVGMKVLPIDEHGEWKPMATRLAEFLETTCDVLWPGVLKTRIPEATSPRFEVRVGESFAHVVMDDSSV